MNPLVSIIVPSYNAEDTLPMALSSLVAQTYPDWECIVVDDGSEDETAEVVNVAMKNHDRIRYVRLEINQGRGKARQVALDQATGQYIAMLDADDWVYPEKLEKQVNIFRLLPDVVLVGTGMAVANREGELAGVRHPVAPGTSLHSKPPIKLGRIPIAFAPCLIQADIARSIGFDPRLRRAEDMDFLLRLLMENRYCVIPDLTYVYNEYVSVDFENVSFSLQNGRLVIDKYRDVSPGRYWRARLKLELYLVAYRLLFNLGYGDRVIQLRSANPTSRDLQNYLLAKESVYKVRNSLFDSR